MQIAHVFPTYYFTSNNELIRTMENFDFENILPLLINGAIVLGFSLVFVIITDIIARQKRRLI